MVARKLKLWRTAGAVAVLGLAACDKVQEAPATDAPVAQAPAATAPDTTAPAASASAGGEAGEGGATTVYAGVQGDQLTALRIQHLRGFVMAAERMVADRAGGSVLDASVLVHQGLLEVYEASPDQFGTLNIAPLREAAGGAQFNRAQMQQRLRASEAALDAAMAPLRTDPADLTARLVDIATSLYPQGVNDQTEYTHSMGAALAARNTLVLNQDAMRQQNLGAFSRSLAEVTRFTALYPEGPTPANPATYQQVLAQSSRVRLALSPYL